MADPSTPHGVALQPAGAMGGTSLSTAFAAMSAQDSADALATSSSPIRAGSGVGGSFGHGASIDGGTASMMMSLSHEESFAMMQAQFEKLQRNFATLSGLCQVEVAKIQRERQALRHRTVLSEQKLRQMKNNCTGIVKLNVGGTKFEVAEGTLRQFPGSFFDVMLDESFPLERDDEGFIFVDRDPRLFSEILQYLRTGDLNPQFDAAENASAAWERRQLVEEAKFYGLDLLATQLQARRRMWLCHSVSQKLIEGVVPSPRCFATMEYVGNNTLYLFGGCTANDLFFDHLYEIKILPSSGRGASSAAAAAYVLGGSKAGDGGSGALAAREIADGPPCGSAGGAAGCLPSLQTEEEEDVERFCFKRISPTGEIPAARSGHAMVLVGGHLVLLFGNNGSAMIEDIVALDVAAASAGVYWWKKLVQRGASVPSRSGHTVCVVKDRLYVIGGKQIFPSMQGFGDIHVGEIDFDQLAITWTELQPCGDPVQKRAYHVAVAYETKIFVYGGIVNDVYCRDTCVYDIDKNTWHVLKEGAPPKYVPSVARSGHVAVAHQNQMIVFGSYSEDGPSMLVHSFNFDTFQWSKVSTVAKAPGKRAAPSAALLPLDTVHNKLPRLMIFGGFDIAARKCFDDVFTLTL